MSRTKISFKKIIWMIIAVVVLGVSAYFLFFNPGRNEVVIRSDKVVQETLTKKVSATGTIKPIQTVEVGTQVSGAIEKLYVDFNDRVKAGQVIAQMDIRNLAATVKESEANLLRAEVQLGQAKRAQTRTSELFEKGTVAKVDLEKADDDYQLALATFNSAELQLKRNKVNLGYATITSPIDGVVISRKVDEGQTVAAAFATPAIYIIAKDLKEMKIEASVDEADIGQVQKGQSVTFTVDAFPDEVFDGKVEQIQLQPVTLQNVVTYTVEIIVSNQDLKLKPGYDCYTGSDHFQPGGCTDGP
jgi:HlyD family secretion protein